MNNKNCPICNSEMNANGYDESGYWKVFECEDCSREVLRKAVKETGGMSPEDLNNLSSF